MRTSNFFFFLPKCHKYLFLMLYHHPHLSKERASQLSLLNGGIEEPESRKLAQAGSGELHSATGRPQAMRGRQDPTGLFCPWGWAESLVQLIHYSPCKVCKCQAQSWGFWFRLQSIATFHGIAPKSMDMPHPWRLSSVKNHQALEVSRMQWLLVWVGRVLKAHPVDRDTFHYARFLQAPSNLALTTPRDGAATAVPVFNLIYRAFAPTLEIFIFTIFAFPLIPTLRDIPASTSPSIKASPPHNNPQLHSLTLHLYLILFTSAQTTNILCLKPPCLLEGCESRVVHHALKWCKNTSSTWSSLPKKWLCQQEGK